MRKISIVSIILVVMCLLSFTMITGCTREANIKITISNSTIEPTTTSTVNPYVTRGDISTDNLTLTFIDVGQGDSIWVESPSHKTMLIDAGDSDEEYKVASELVNVKNIDVVVATHPHADHIGGMKAVLNTYSISQFVDAGYPHTTSMYENMLSTIDTKKISYTTVKNGDFINLDPSIKIKVLNPQPKFFNELNDNSVVLLMTYKNVSFLLTGDTQLNAESMYARNLGRVDILKVAHHGSSTSTGSYLISKTHPKVSIISVGKDNSYNHPDMFVIKRLVNDGSVVYRTDLNGSIVVTTDGNSYSVITERS